MYKTIAALLLVSMVVATSDSVMFTEFEKFMIKYNKVYASPEEMMKRFAIFNEHLSFVGAQALSGNTAHGITKFSDLTREEFRTTYLTAKVNSGWCESSLKLSAVTSPASLDYRTEGKVSPVKDQGQCGSCWAFSTTAFLESQVLMASETATTFSEQQLVDCDTRSGDEGCNGGLQQHAFNYIASNGLMNETDYRSYHASQGECNYVSSEATTTVANIKCHEGSTDSEIKRYLASVGPMAIAVDATDFQTYSSGILRSSGTQLDHAVLLVGYGTEEGEDYWIIKNSWAANWGEEGFVRVSMDAGENCAVGVYVVSADKLDRSGAATRFMTSA